jgi:hypothetical protein
VLESLESSGKLAELIKALQVGRSRKERIPSLSLRCLSPSVLRNPSVFQAAQKLLDSFGPSNFLIRIVKSSGDKARFEEVHMQLTTWMLVGSVA